MQTKLRTKVYIEIYWNINIFQQRYDDDEDM